MYPTSPAYRSAYPLDHNESSRETADLEAGPVHSPNEGISPTSAPYSGPSTSRLHALKFWQGREERANSASQWRGDIEKTFNGLMSRKKPELDITPGQFDWRRFGRKLLINCGRELAISGSALGSGFMAQRLLAGSPRAGKEQAPTINPSTGTAITYNQMLALSAFFAVPMYARPVFEKVAESVAQAKLRGPARLQKMYQNRQRRWITEEALAGKPAHIADAIRNLDTEIPKRIEQAKNATGNVRDQLITLAECMMRWQDLFLVHRPDQRRSVDKWLTAAGRQELYRNMQEHVQDMEDSRLKNKLLSYFTRIAIRSVELELPSHTVRDADDAQEAGNAEEWHHWDSIPAIPALNIFLLGAEGTGKSRFLGSVKEVLGLPVASLTVPPMVKGGMEDTLAKTWDATKQVKYITNDPDLLGKLGLILIKLGCENGVLNIDEPNWEDVAGIKRLLDPWRETIEATALNTAFEWMRVTRVITANDVPEEEERRTADKIQEKINAAVHDRVDVALFGEASWEAKRNAAIRAYKDIASMFCLPMKGGDGPVLNAAQQAEMQRAFKAALPNLVDWQHAKQAGLRMHVAVEYLVHRIYHRLQEQAMSGEEGLNNPDNPELDIEDVLRDVEDHYAPQPDKNPYANGTDRLRKAMEKQVAGGKHRIAAVSGAA